MGRGWGWVAAAVVCLTWACGPTVEEATGGLPDTGQPPPGSPLPSPVWPPTPQGPAACAEHDLGRALPVLVTGTLTDGSNHHRACNSQTYGDGADTSYAWTAPETALYVFDTSGSTSGVLLDVRSGSCDGPVLACSRREGQGYGYVPQARLPLKAGETVAIFLDGGGSLHPDFSLRIAKAAPSEAGACQDGMDNDGDGAVDCGDPECDGIPACTPSVCAAVDLGSALPVRHVGTTSAEHVRFAPSCAPGGLGSERVHSFTPPHSGHYALSVRRRDSEDAFLPMLHLLADCAGETELACVPAQAHATGRYQWLEGGKPVLLVVRDTAGREAGYELTVTRYVDREAGLCGDGLDNDADGRRDAEDSDCIGTCSPTRCQDLKASCGEYPDGCGGTLQCGSCGEGRTCGAVIPGACGKCIVAADLGSTLPLRHSGMPEGFLNYIPMHGEVLSSTFTWTAPRTGDYVISNAVSGASSRLTVRLGSCNGQEVPGSHPLLPDRYSLKAGDTVYLTLFGDGARLGWVDSYYHLHITEAAPGGEQGLCADRLDNDGDGKVDCQDADCGATPECQGRACADVDLGNALPAWGSTPTSRGYNFFRPSCAFDSYPGRDERVYAWTAPKAGRYVFHGRWRDGLLSLRNGCAGPELACVNFPGVGQKLERVVLVREMAQGESLIVVLEGTEGEDELPVDNSDQLFVHEWAPEEGPGLCEDQRDNDGDGLADELDPGC